MIDRKNMPVVVECYTDNGEHSHFKLIDVETGGFLWEESETAHNNDYAKLKDALESIAECGGCLTGEDAREMKQMAIEALQ
jgi:hypothetical protein